MAFQERYAEIRDRIVQIILAVLIVPLCIFSIAPASATVFDGYSQLETTSMSVAIGETVTVNNFSVLTSNSINDTMSVTVVPVSCPAGHEKSALMSIDGSYAA